MKELIGERAPALLLFLSDIKKRDFSKVHIQPGHSTSHWEHLHFSLYLFGPFCQIFLDLFNSVLFLSCIWKSHYSVVGVKKPFTRQRWQCNCEDRILLVRRASNDAENRQEGQRSCFSPCEQEPLCWPYNSPVQGNVCWKENHSFFLIDTRISDTVILHWRHHSSASAPPQHRVQVHLLSAARGFVLLRDEELLRNSPILKNMQITDKT